MTTIEKRFWRKVDTNGENGCWLWTGAKTAAGYGRFGLNRKEHYAHRLAYEMLVGPIPDGLVIDHLCRVRNCVKPDHLEPVSQQVNCQRQGIHPLNSSGFRGVTWNKASQQWQVTVKCNGRFYSGGYFAEIQQAAEAAEELRRRVFSGDTSQWDEPRQCTECGSHFTGLRSDAKFCSTKCRGLASGRRRKVRNQMKKQRDNTVSDRSKNKGDNT